MENQEQQVQQQILEQVDLVLVVVLIIFRVRQYLDLQVTLLL